MKKVVIILLLSILFISCGDHLKDLNPDQHQDQVDSQTEFLFSVIGMVMALAVANLVKGFDVIIKYSPQGLKPSLTTVSRWQMRFFWGVSLAFLIFQLVWGMRLALEESTNVWFFIYYVVLSGSVYSMVVYVFPENIEDVFKREKKWEHEKYWSKRLIDRLFKLYIIYAFYLFITIPMSFIFLIKYHGIYGGSWFQDGNIFGILLKFFAFIILIKAIRIKSEQKKKQESDNNPDNNRGENNGKAIILKLDYYIVALSIFIHIYYTIIRTITLW